MEMIHDFTDFLTRASSRVADSRIGGGYARTPGARVPDLYGTAAAVGIRLALGDRPSGAEAGTLAATLRGWQDADGRFADATHGEMHRAATAVTTLQVLGEKPATPAFVDPLLRADRVADVLGGLDWDEPWLASHAAAGLLAIGLTTGASDPVARASWVGEYLDWLDDHADPVTGLWLTGRMGRLEDAPGLFGNLGCAFHLHFLYEKVGRPWPRPDGVIDVGLTLFRHAAVVLPADPGDPDDWGFRQLDWAYSVGRAARCGHRTPAVAEAFADLARHAATALAAPTSTDGDLHVVQARVGLVAELAHLLPDAVASHGATLTPIVDRRPFI
ncbi:hypothetical protein AB3M83_03620 [Microbacterium sp. 179-B 1A2 NHS]|uniref:hypothetical protein n=1 Tax=Microbacterium sp. 179-B 1A2 NHS TaxID=3142383 RepID=UPI0039A37868